VSLPTPKGELAFIILTSMALNWQDKFGKNNPTDVMTQKRSKKQARTACLKKDLALQGLCHGWRL